MSTDPMISCDEARARWLRSLDDRVADVLASAHIERCEACQRHARGIERILCGLGELREATQIVGLDAADRGGIKRSQRVPQRRYPFAFPLIRVAAVIALALLGVYSWSLYRSSQPPTAPVIAAKQSVKREAQPGVAMKLLGESRRSYVAVASTSKTDVDVIWLYPTSPTRSERNDSKTRIHQ